MGRQTKTDGESSTEADLCGENHTNKWYNSVPLVLQDFCFQY